MKPLDNPNFYLNSENQSWFLRQHFEHNGRRLRFIIRRGAYESTSSAVVQIQDANTLGWLGLASLPVTQMKAHGSYVIRDLCQRDKDTFLEDLRELQKMAEMLI